MAESDIAKLTKRKAILKGQLTRFCNFVNSVDGKKDSILLQTRLDTVRDIHAEFDSVQSEIEFANEDEQVAETHRNERVEFENKYFEAISRSKKILMEAVSHTDVVSTSRVSHNVGEVSIKLPPINLPEFHGDYERWSHFSDTFKAVIHNNNTLSKVQKHQYLVSCLKGSAAKAISGLTISDKNYDSAWKLLSERYEDTKSTINSHIKAIFLLPSSNRDTHITLRALLDDFVAHYHALENLGEEVDHWDTILIFLLTGKMDNRSNEEFAIYTKNMQNPKLSDLIQFLKDRCGLLENIKNKTAYTGYVNKRNTETRSLSYATANKISCPVCQQSHFIFACKTFRDMPINERYNEVRRLKLCVNCFRAGHINVECRSSTCKVCQKPHNTLLHRTYQNSVNNTQSETQTQLSAQSISETETKQDNVLTVCSQANADSFVLLSTALVYVYNVENQPVICRVLLDSASQSCYIRDDLVKRLGLSTNNINITVSGISQTTTSITEQVNIKVKSMHNNFTTELPCLIVNKITENIPQRRININSFAIPTNIKLADPKFNIPAQIDMLIGAALFFELLEIGRIKLGTNQLLINKTKLGWVISGQTCGFQHCQNSDISTSCSLITNKELDNNLKTFWEIEENITNQILSKEESECEQDFVTNFKRDSTGRFEVRLPTRKNYTKLGDSFQTAVQRFFTMESKLAKNMNLKREYTAFLNEYEALGHMTLINPEQCQSDLTYYLPHHAVLKNDSITTKLRVVFDASAKTSSGLSLNDVLQVGPTIQSDLFSILIRFRQHNIVLIADIAKMYRQVNVTSSQRDLQRIVWRDDPTSELRHYRLNTLTYGTAPASFLATRCLKQLALENAVKYPNESNIILTDFYVDDLLTGTSDVDKMIELQKNVVSILDSAGLELRKFMSNDTRVIQNLRDSDNLQYVIRNDESTKTLGVAWNSTSDQFEYNININSSENKTKRAILSHIAQIFDPLGLLGAVVIQAKIILQQLWQIKIGWDEVIPHELDIVWKKYANQLEQMCSIQIPRLVIINNAIKTQIHGFADASIKAYGATVYVRSEDKNGLVHVNLLCAKSRVAPLKAISLPRLELCAALLLAKLISKVIKTLTIPIDEIYCWTDSTIVLSWLAAEPQTWQTFICNRVSEIQQLTQTNNWNHVSSSNNPADIISRGIDPKDISECALWWSGPSFLSQPQSGWPENSHISIFARKPENTPEHRNKIVILHSISNNDFLKTLVSKYSSWSKLQRVFAYCLRFINNLKTSQKSKQTGSLTVSELAHSTQSLIKIVQSRTFAEDIHSLMVTKSVKATSKIKSLNPFLDQKGILRVGGRLKNSNIQLSQRNPILLPSKHELTILIIRFEHIRNLHPGPQATLACVRQNYWPLNGRQIVKSIVRKCIPCFRVQPRPMSQQMGNLPETRVTPSRPFSFCGVDYAGPYQIKESKFRNKKVIKGYICIFVCFSTKAVHIELVSELTSEGFLNALKRFVSRRGLCRRIHSDNATNFQGAKNKLLLDITKLLQENKFKNYLEQCNIEWQFIPPRSPHMGGLWEAAVRSVKQHLKRVSKNFIFSYEELYTLLTLIEAVLNSRPIIPLSDSPDDLQALTPGHLLIGEPLTAVQEVDLRDAKTSYLSRYQHIVKMSQDIWKRWSRDYLNQLQQRTKWRFRKEPSTLIGALVLLLEDNTPPLLWPMGRIVELHPGRDQLVRVVSVKAKGGVVKRAINKLCLMPIEA